MSLKPRVFPVEDVKKAGLLEKENRETRAAIQAASFVEGFSVFDSRSESYSGNATVVLAEGTLKVKANQYVQFVGSVLWIASTALHTLRIGVYVDGNNTATFETGYIQKSATTNDEVQTIPVHAFYKAPRANCSVQLKAVVATAGNGSLYSGDIGYFRFSGGPT